MIRVLWMVVGLPITIGMLIAWLQSMHVSVVYGNNGLAQDVSIALGDPIEGVELPVHITHAGDGSGRLFVVEQAGRIRIVRDEVVQKTPFLDISDRVVCCGERGLLSVAFPPEYDRKGYFYVNYTDSSTNGDTVIARYRLTSDPDRADADSEEILLTVDQPFGNHNGGQIAFGPDGYLYIGMGDGGSAGDPDNYAQNPDSLLGKLLRIDVEHDTAVSYIIPPTNPYTTTVGYRAEIWALGLRNPWRFSFDRQTGDLYIGDVGQGAFEEINVQLATSDGGENYGWRCKEGTSDFRMSEECARLSLVEPVYEYGREGGNCSVSGGVVYRGTLYERLQGIYLYGDYCSGLIWGLQQEENGWRNDLLLASSLNGSLTSFGESETGEVYVTNYSGDSLHQIIVPGAATATSTPTSASTATATSTPIPTSTAFPISTATFTLTSTPSSTPTGTPHISPTPTSTGVVLSPDDPSVSRIFLPLLRR